MKGGLTYKQFRTMRRRLKLAAHILSSAGGIMDDAYPRRLESRWENLRDRLDDVLYDLDYAQQIARKPHHRVDDDGCWPSSKGY